MRCCKISNFRSTSFVTSLCIVVIAVLNFSPLLSVMTLSILVDEIQVKTLKIPSGDITNGPLLLAHARTRRDLIVSTGMSTLGEIEDALALIAFGFAGQQ